MSLTQLNTAWRTWCQAHPTEAAQVRQQIRTAQQESWQVGQAAVLAAYVTHLHLTRREVERACR